MQQSCTIITSGVKLPHGMDGFNTQSGTFVRWVEGSHQPVPGPSELQPQNLLVHGKCLTWNTAGYYEMSAKNSTAYRAKVHAGSSEPDNSRPTIKHVSFQSSLTTHCSDKVVAFEKGVCVRVTEGLHSGKIGLCSPTRATALFGRTILLLKNVSWHLATSF